MPVVNDETVPIKTDFTIYHNGTTYYWEHLGRLGDKNYARKWKEIKFPTYQRFGMVDKLISSDELNGIDPKKIDEIIQHIIEGNLVVTDPSFRYSSHHYSLR